MYRYGRSGGPSQKTPGNVQCQKCLKRGHYSYECKANPQERPYVARPSRTQQLLNPRLKPKLTEDSPDAFQKKKGVADEELAKKEAERAKKRELEEREDLALQDPPPKRQRSASYDSVQSISTRSRSRSPPRKMKSRSPSRERDEDSRAPPPRRRSLDSRDDYSSGRSESPEGDYERREPLRRSSPPRGNDDRASFRIGDEGSERGAGRHGHSKRALSKSPSRSPSRSPVNRGDRARREDRRYRERDDRESRAERRQDKREPPMRAPPPEPPRERSLSPFSKRLALTQAMNR